MRTIGFHASKDKIRFVVLDGTASNPTVLKHDRRPLQLLPDRPDFIQTAQNLFGSVLSAFNPDKVAYVLTMSAKSQAQIASLVLPFGALNVCAKTHSLSCSEFIAANFQKKFFEKRGAAWVTNRNDSADALLGTHPPNWTDSERQAALAAWGVM